MEKWLPIFWILGLCIGFFAVLMLTDYIKSRKKKPDRRIN